MLFMDSSEDSATPKVERQEIPAPQHPKPGRRELLEHLGKIGASALALAVGGNAMAAPAGTSPASASDVPADGVQKRRFRYGMVIDTRRCVGCGACVIACKAENKTPPGVFNIRLHEEPEKSSSVDKPIFMTRPCFHCENPPCVAACPMEGATFKRASDGLVVVNYDLCAGVQECIRACPYGARTFDDGKNYPAVEEHSPYTAVPSPEYNQFRSREGDRATTDKVRKCTFCMHLQNSEGRYDRQSGRWPACAKTCTGHAIHFGDFHDPASEVSKLLKSRKAIRLKESLGTEPNVYYLL